MNSRGADDASDGVAHTDDMACTTLTSLPAELVHRVCDSIEDSYDILSMRLACKDLFFKVEDHFLDRYMTDRRHLITKYSLETLVTITKRPALIRRLRSLSLTVAEKSYYYVHQRHNCGKRQPASPEQQQAIWSKWCAESDSVTNGNGAKLFAEALRNLKQAGYILPLHLDYPNERSRYLDDGQVPLASFGFRKLLKNLGITRDELNEHDLFLWHLENHPQSTSLFLQGIAQAQYPIRDLTIGDHFWVQLSPEAFVMEPDIFRNLQASLASLVKLDLSLEVLEYDRENIRAAMNAFGDAMKLATGLRILKLTFDLDYFRDSRYSGFSAALGDVFQHSRQLTSITLKNTMIEPDVFLSFLDQHHTTLEELDLTEVNFEVWPICTWPKVLRKIASLVPNLAHCHIESMDILADDVLGAKVEDSRYYTWDFKGLGEVKEKLELMAESVEYQNQPWH